jgi:hypothetical protein
VFVALVTRHAKRMRRIVVPSVACLALPYFSLLSHKRHDFGGKVAEHKICVFIFSTDVVSYISQRYCHKFENVFV